MRHDRFTSKKTVHGLLEYGVGVGYALVLAQMLEPGELSMERAPGPRIATPEP
jgi:hypothetical protein